MDQTINNSFLRLMKNAFRDAQLCDDFILGTNQTMHGKSVALSYAETALSYCLAAESLFYACLAKRDHV